MLDSHKFPSVESDWCEFLNVVGHSDKLKESRMPKSKNKCSAKLFAFRYRCQGCIIKVMYTEICIHTYKLIKLKEDLPLCFLEKTSFLKNLSKTLNFYERLMVRLYLYVFSL